MDHVVTAPEMLVSAATDVEQIGSAISAANSAAAGPTTGLLSAAQDEVSAAIAKAFGEYGAQYQAVVKQAATFHGSFTDALAAAGSTYAQAEAGNATGLASALGNLGTRVESLLGVAPTGAGAPTGGAGGGGVQALLAASQADVALVMGGTFNPGPDPGYLSIVNSTYIQRLFPGAVSIGQFTPEQFWPVTPDLGNMTFGTSVANGVQLLNTSILDQINNQHHSVAVFGYSQSATIATDEIKALMAAGSPYQNQLSFVLVGDPNNPDGGILSRFPGFYIPFLNVDFNGATPPNSPYHTDIYTIQYDGIADAPQYPLNVVSDLNAFLGYFYVHNQYPTLTPAQLDGAVQLPTSPGSGGNTDYYMIMTQDLPLIRFIHDIPYAGPPLADIIEPDLRVLVDMGYGDLGTGFDYANVSTPASLFAIPNVPNIATDLIKGAIQGPYGAAVQIGIEAGAWGPEWLPQTYPFVPSPDPHLHVYLGQPTVTQLSLLSGGVGDLLKLIPPFS